MNDEEKRIAEWRLEVREAAAYAGVVLNDLVLKLTSREGEFETDTDEMIRFAGFLCSDDASLDDIIERAASPGKEQVLYGLEHVLGLHYVTAIDCDHDAKTDTVRCNCSVWTGQPQPSIGKAVMEWVDHVIWELAGPRNEPQPVWATRQTFRELADAMLTAFIYEHGSDFDAAQWPEAAALRAALGEPS